MADKPTRVREPIQVYLDARDRSLLDKLAEDVAVPRAEILRMGLRRLGTEIESGSRGAGLKGLIGVMEGVDAPADLAERHDEYLYATTSQAKPRKRRRR